MDNTELENKIEELSSKLEELEKSNQDRDEKIETLENKPIILDRNLDNQSKDIIEDIISERIFDIVWNDYFYFQTYLEFSFNGLADGWGLVDSSTTPSTNVSNTGVGLATGSTLNDESYFQKAPVSDIILDFDKESRYSTTFTLSHTSSQEIFLGVGAGFNGSAISHYGFLIIDNNLYGVVSGGATQTQVLLFSGITGNAMYVEAHLLPGSRVDFFVRDNTELTNKLRGSLSTNIPKGAIDIWLRVFIKATTAAWRQINIPFIEYVQRRKGR